MLKRSILHNELVRRSEAMLRQLRKLWNGTEFQDVLFTWAGEEIRDDNGMPINDLVGCDLPNDRGEHNKIAVDMVVRTSACGLLRVRREDDNIQAIMETHDGSKSWTFPFQVRGDTRVIGSPTTKENEDFVGVLWKKDMGRS